ncbi:MAG: hypothetical protein N2Z74_06255, partial [Syntrophales bacterium]|nr:hypothetical protein [Syntrophales bacterium]
MSWKDYYNSHLMTMQEAVKLIQSGDCLWTPLMLGQPSMAMMDAVADRKDELSDVEYINCLTVRPYKIFQPEYRDTFKLAFGFYSTPHLMKLAQSEWANFLPYQS